MLLVLADVGHSYAEDGDIWLFRGLSFEFEPGRSYAVTGASGSGKSTLMAIISGWIAPSEGTIAWDSGLSTSWVFQNPHGVPRRTALDHVAYPLIATGSTPSDADDQAKELLHRFELGHAEDREFRHLSGGEAQRLMLARATAMAPNLLLVDEPTAQLDRSTAITVNRVLGNTVTTDTILIVATHDGQTRDACDVHLDLGTFAPTRGGGE
jgi:lipoprotein-releasing system ATP-binding protein